MTAHLPTPTQTSPSQVRPSLILGKRLRILALSLLTTAAGGHAAANVGEGPEKESLESARQPASIHWNKALEEALKYIMEKGFEVNEEIMTKSWIHDAVPWESLSPENGALLLLEYQSSHQGMNLSPRRQFIGQGTNPLHALVRGRLQSSYVAPHARFPVSLERSRFLWVGTNPDGSVSIKVFHYAPMNGVANEFVKKYQGNHRVINEVLGRVSIPVQQTGGEQDEQTEQSKGKDIGGRTLKGKKEPPQYDHEVRDPTKDPQEKTSEKKEQGKKKEAKGKGKKPEGNVKDKKSKKRREVIDYSEDPINIEGEWDGEGKNSGTNLTNKPDDDGSGDCGTGPRIPNIKKGDRKPPKKKFEDGSCGEPRVIDTGEASGDANGDPADKDCGTNSRGPLIGDGEGGETEPGDRRCGTVPGPFSQPDPNAADEELFEHFMRQGMSAKQAVSMFHRTLKNADDMRRLTRGYSYRSGVPLNSNRVQLGGMESMGRDSLDGLIGGGLPGGGWR